MFKICVDTGGTFTDCVVLDMRGGLHEFKSPTTPWDFSEGVINTIVDAAAYFNKSTSDFLKETEWLVHGTTVSTNALVQRKLAKTALITSRGFRDIIEMRCSLKIETHSMYEAFIPPYEPIIPRYLRYTVAEKTKVTGEIVTPVNEEELKKVIGKIKAEGVESIAICFINSYVNAANELKAAEICKEHLGDSVFISCSSLLLPKMGEYERESTCVINAGVGPIVDNYLNSLETKLRDAGFTNQLLIVQANQFLQSVQAITEKPVYLTGSGPAAGPAGAVYLGEAIDEENFLIGDMGGTTWDASLVKDRKVSLKSGDWLGDDRLGIKVADVISIGAGGGSIGWLDSLGLLRVGPQSASSNPGPACYGLGGTEPTVTDAAVILGYIDPDNFCGGKLKLQPGLSRQAMQKISDGLGLSIEETAQAMFDTVNSNMADAISEISTRKGYDVRDFNLLATGGGGPLCGTFVAGILGMKKTIIPIHSSLFCAWAMFYLDVGRDYVRSHVSRSHLIDLKVLNKLYEDMAEEAMKDVAAFHVSRGDMAFTKSVEMRYQGQYHVLEVPLPDGEIRQADIRTMEENFHKLHDELFTFSLSGVPMEMINMRLTAKIKSSKLPIGKREPGPAEPDRAFIKHSACYFNNERSMTPIYDGLKLEAGNIIHGNAIIQEPTATTVIPRGMVCKVDSFGNYIITPQDWGKEE